MSHIYKVIDESNDRGLGYWQADTKGEAKRAAIKHITAERLSGSEIVDVSRNGYAITDAKTGKCCNAPEPQTRISGSTETQLDAFDPPTTNETQAPQG